MADQNTNCDNEKIIYQHVMVQAQVTITPLIKHGKPKIYCINAEFDPCRNINAYKENCYPTGERSCGSCFFTVEQVLCIEIPITFDVNVDVNQGVLCCGESDLGQCIPPCKGPQC